MVAGLISAQASASSGGIGGIRRHRLGWRGRRRATARPGLPGHPARQARRSRSATAAATSRRSTGSSRPRTSASRRSPTSSTAPTEGAVERVPARRRPAASTASSTSTTATRCSEAMPTQLATWYGPGLFGNQTACGQTLTRETHRRRPQDASLRLEGRVPLQGPLRADHGDRPRPVRQRRRMGSDPGDRRRSFASRRRTTIRVAKLAGLEARASAGSQRSYAQAAVGRTAESVWSCGSAAAFAIRLWNSFIARCATASSSSSSVQSVLPRLLGEVLGRAAVGREQRLEEGEQRRLLRVARLEAAGRRDLVEAEAGGAGRLRVLGDRVRVAAALGDGEPDPLAGGRRQRAAAQLVAHPRVGAQRRRGAGEHADELRDLARGALRRP